MNTLAKNAAPSAAPKPVSLPLFYKSLAPFNKKEHAQLAFPDTLANFRFATNTNAIPLLVTEVGQAEASYPIVLMSVREGDSLTLVVLVGLNGTNRYVTAEGLWKKDTYIPAWVRRYPFFAVQVEGKGDPLLAIDTGYDDLNAKSGKAFFDKDGNPTERLQNVLNFNQVYKRDADSTQIALDALKKSGVLEEGTLQRRTAKEGEAKNFTGFFVVNEKKLMALPDDQIVKLHRSGALGLAYAQMMSMRNIKHLID